MRLLYAPLEMTTLKVTDNPNVCFGVFRLIALDTMVARLIIPLCTNEIGLDGSIKLAQKLSTNFDVFYSKLNTSYISLHCHCLYDKMEKRPW